MWIDTHCHLNAPEFSHNRFWVRHKARSWGIVLCVIPAVEVGQFELTCQLAHQGHDAYALGIHPLYVDRANDSDLATLDKALTAACNDRHLVGIGEIGLDLFEPHMRVEPLCSKQEYFCREQLKLARKHGLPVLLHVRRAIDPIMAMLGRIQVRGGIAHAFNGSDQQARHMIKLGFKLGFGGACTYDRATKLRALVRNLPLESIVLETDSPDMQPAWLHTSASERASGALQPPNTPDQLVTIAGQIAQMRGLPLNTLARSSSHNALEALPKLEPLVL